jgi:transcriptional regulator with XRE-family HTH domain
MTLVGRMKMAMATVGITGADEKERIREFARRLNVKRPNFHRQTVHKWFKDNVKQLSPEYLFLVADVLECNPRWLALREGEPQQQPQLSLDQIKAVQLYNALRKHPAHRDQWMRNGSDLLQLATGPSVAQPFK